MNDNIATPKGRIDHGSNGAEPAGPMTGTREEPLDPATLIASALEWVEENQTLAMLGAFAVGVFVGVMLRD